MLIFYMIRCCSSSSEKIQFVQMQLSSYFDILKFETQIEMNNLQNQVKNRLLIRLSLDSPTEYLPYLKNDGYFLNEHHFKLAVEKIFARFNEITNNLEKDRIHVINRCLDTQIRLKAQINNSLIFQIQVCQFYIFLNTEFKWQFAKNTQQSNMIYKQEFRNHLIERHSSFKFHIESNYNTYEYILRKLYYLVNGLGDNPRYDYIKLRIEEIRNLIESTEFFGKDAICSLISDYSNETNSLILTEIYTISSILYCRNIFDADLIETSDFNDLQTSFAQINFDLGNFSILALFLCKRKITTHKQIVIILKAFKIYLIRSNCLNVNFFHSFNEFYELFSIEMVKKCTRKFNKLLRKNKPVIIECYTFINLLLVDLLKIFDNFYIFNN